MSREWLKYNACHWPTGRTLCSHGLQYRQFSAGWIYGVIQHIPDNQPQFPFFNQNSKKGSWHDLLPASVIQLPVLPLLCPKHHNALTIAIFRAEGGKKQQVAIKSTVADSGGAATVNLFTHKVESLAHLDNTVNSNQDPVISNYRPWAAGRWGVMKWHMWVSIYL